MPPARQLCSHCPLRSVGMQLISDVQNGDSGLIALHPLRRGQILESDMLSEQLLIVQSGSIKVEYMRDDGRAAVAAFLLAGEPAIAAFSREPVVFTALEDTILCTLELSRIRADNENACKVLREMFSAFGLQAAEDQKRLLQARTGSVNDRLFWFLQDLSKRGNRKKVNLAMSRDDIAYYLETTPESISRAFSSLTESGLIVRETPRQIRMLQ